MAIPISGLRRSKSTEPPRLCFYGPPGMGKTTLASEFPDAVFLQVEDGTPGDVELNTFGKLNSYVELMDQVVELQEAEHDLKTVVVDSLTALQRYVWEETCTRGDDKGNPKANIEDFGYGKGYIYALRVWQEFLTEIYKLRSVRGMCIIFIGHSKVVRFDDPETVSYDRYEIDIHDKARALFDPDMDAILLLKSPVTIKEEKSGFDKKRSRGDGRGANIVIHAIGRPAYVAKNRYGIPETLPFVRGQGYAALDRYFPGGIPAETKQAAE
jgi:DNA polymerase III delta prime subunit